MAIEEKPEIAAQMREALACHLGALLCLGEDEGALQNAGAGTNLNGIANSGTAVGFTIDNDGNFHNFTANSPPLLRSRL